MKTEKSSPARARAAGMVDAALVKAGKAAKARQRKRARKTAFKTAGKIALAAGAVAATFIAGRAIKRKAMDDARRAD